MPAFLTSSHQFPHSQRSSTQSSTYLDGASSSQNVDQGPQESAQVARLQHAAITPDDSHSALKHALHEEGEGRGPRKEFFALAGAGMTSAGQASDNFMLLVLCLQPHLHLPFAVFRMIIQRHHHHIIIIATILSVCISAAMLACHCLYANTGMPLTTPLSLMHVQHHQTRFLTQHFASLFTHGPQASAALSWSLEHEHACHMTLGNRLAGSSTLALFVYNDSAACYFYNTRVPPSVHVQQQYQIAGWLAGQALHNRAVLGIRLAPLMWQKILDGEEFQVNERALLSECIVPGASQADCKPTEACMHPFWQSHPSAFVLSYVAEHRHTVAYAYAVHACYSLQNEH